MPKRASQSGEKCRTPKVVRNKDDLSERKISRSKLNRKKRGRQKMSSSFFRRVFVTVARSFLGSVLCRYNYKRAVIERFHNVAEGNISRLRDAQAFHAAVKRPPYFMFARSADISPPGTACPACAVCFGAWFVYGKTAKANAPRHRVFVASPKILFHHKYASVWIKRIFCVFWARLSQIILTILRISLACGRVIC